MGRNVIIIAQREKRQKIKKYACRKIEGNKFHLSILLKADGGGCPTYITHHTTSHNNNNNNNGKLASQDRLYHVCKHRVIAFHVDTSFQHKQHDTHTHTIHARTHTILTNTQTYTPTRAHTTH